MRLALAQFVRLALVFILVASQVTAQNDQNVRRLVRTQLYAGINEAVRADQSFSIPLSVLRQLVDQRLSDAAWQDVRTVAIKETPYTQLDTGEALLRTISTELAVVRQTAIAESLSGISSSTIFQSDISLIPSDTTLNKLQRDLQASAASNFHALVVFQSKLSPIQAAAVKEVIADFDSNGNRAEILKQATDAGHQITELLKEPSLDASKLNAQAVSVLKELNDKTRMFLGSSPTVEPQLRSYCQKLADLASIIGQPGTPPKGTALPNLPKLTPELSVGFLQSIVQLHDAHAAFSNALNNEGATLAEGLQNGIGVLNGGWGQLVDAVNKVTPPTAGQNILPDQIKNLQPFISDFNSLNNILKGDQPLGVPQLSRALTAVGVLPQGTVLIQASTALSDIVARKGDYTSAVTGVLSTLSVLNQNGISIPGMQQLAPVLSTANSILKAAGPLTTIAGFASGLSAFSLIGGLGGLGGGGDDAIAGALSQINAKLDMINSKLDTVLVDLNKLSEQIAKDHAEEMNALEAIGWDVARTYKLIVLELHDQVGKPCLRASDPTEVDRQAQLDKCENALADIYATRTPLSDPPKELTFETNLVSLEKSTGDTSLGQFKQELTFRRDLSNLLATTDCQGLVYPSSDFDQLRYKVDSYGSSDNARQCASLLQSNLLEPGVVSQYVTWEQNALAATPRLGQQQAVGWWQRNGAALKDRWANKELPLLNLAIIQQTAVSGDILLRELTAAVDEAFSNDDKLAALHKIWNTNGVLPENIARYWLWSNMKGLNGGVPNGDTAQSQSDAHQQWRRTLYAFAWESGDDRYWYLLTKADPSKVRFALTPRNIVKPDGTDGKEMIWTIQFRDLDPVPMPRPSETNLLEFRWPSTLVQLVSARDQILEALGGMGYVEQAWAKSDNKETAKNLLEVLIITAPKK